MEKRVLLAVALSFAVLYGYQVLFPPQKLVQNPAPASSPATANRVDPATAPPAPEAESPAAPQDAPLVGEGTERDIVVENELVRAVFTNRGAVLKNWILKRYTDRNGVALDLVPQVVRGAARPFSLLAEDGKLTATLNNAIYQPSADGLTVGTTAAALSF